MLETQSRYCTELDQGPIRNPWLKMDSSLSNDMLQEMFDIDIKSDLESLLTEQLDLNISLDMPSLDLNEPIQNDAWLGCPDPLANEQNDNFGGNFILDLSADETLMVNPDGTFIVNPDGTFIMNPNETLMVNPNETWTVNTDLSLMVNPGSVMPCMSLVSLPNNKVKHEVVDIEEQSENEIENETESESEAEIEPEVENENENENGIENDHGNENDTETEIYGNEDTTETEDTEDEQDIERPVTPLKLRISSTSSATIIKDEDDDDEDDDEPSPSAQSPRMQMTPKVNAAVVAKAHNVKFVQRPSPRVKTQLVRKQIYNNHNHHNHHHHNNNNNNNNSNDDDDEDDDDNDSDISPDRTTIVTTPVKREKQFDMTQYDENYYPKPAYSYSCLIAMALKNSRTGLLPVAKIYKFMCKHFPYFKTAPNGWKNSVRHNLSLNKCFEKIENPLGNGNQRKGCLWATHPTKLAKMDEEILRSSRKDPMAIKRAMIYPDRLELLERGQIRYVKNDNVAGETSSSEDESTEELAMYHRALHENIAMKRLMDNHVGTNQYVDISKRVRNKINVNGKETPHTQLRLSEQKVLQYELIPKTKRQKHLSPAVPGNRVYQPAITPRKKAPLIVRTGSGASSFLKID